MWSALKDRTWGNTVANMDARSGSTGCRRHDSLVGGGMWSWMPPPSCRPRWRTSNVEWGCTCRVTGLFYGGAVQGCSLWLLATFPVLGHLPCPLLPKVANLDLSLPYTRQLLKALESLLTAQPSLWHLRFCQGLSSTVWHGPCPAPWLFPLLLQVLWQACWLLNQWLSTPPQGPLGNMSHLIVPHRKDRWFGRAKFWSPTCLCNCAHTSQKECLFPQYHSPNTYYCTPLWAEMQREVRAQSAYLSRLGHMSASQSVSSWRQRPQGSHFLHMCSSTVRQQTCGPGCHRWKE